VPLTKSHEAPDHHTDKRYDHWLLRDHLKLHDLTWDAIQPTAEAPQLQLKGEKLVRSRNATGDPIADAARRAARRNARREGVVPGRARGTQDDRHWSPPMHIMSPSPSF
jgi:hypothetical protein